MIPSVFSLTSHPKRGPLPPNQFVPMHSDTSEKKQMFDVDLIFQTVQGSWLQWLATSAHDTYRLSK